jgi:hypothetical protein
MKMKMMIIIFGPRRSVSFRLHKTVRDSNNLAGTDFVQTGDASGQNLFRCVDVFPCSSYTANMPSI